MRILKCPHCGEYIEPVLDLDAKKDHIVIVCPICKAELTQEDLGADIYTQIISKPKKKGG